MIDELICARVKKGLTINEVATLAGISYEVYRRIEKGISKNPHAQTLYKICEVLDIDFAIFLSKWVTKQHTKEI